MARDMELSVKVIKHFASEFTPCGCNESPTSGVLATPVEWIEEEDGSEFTCVNCGDFWFLKGVHGSSLGGILLRSDHPAEVARRNAA